jgi:1,3-beta-glucan synthase
MYREHLITAETLEKMLYQHVTDETGQKHLKEPTFFIAQEDSSLKGEYFSHHSEAERRFSYFAQSLATTLPEPVSVERMPTFTVLTPHYSEKILLSLKEIIRENDKRTRITLLEYLKKMHRDEWENFVRDSKLLAEEMPELTETLPGYSSSPDASTRDGSCAVTRNWTISLTSLSATNRLHPSSLCVHASGLRFVHRPYTVPCLAS